MTTIPENQGVYQGYPYRNPTVTEVQSVDPDTASRWANLPRKQIILNNNSIHGISSSEQLNISNNNEGDDLLSNNVNIDLAIIQTDEINQRRNEVSLQHNSEYQGYPYRNHTATDVQSMDPETALKWSNLSGNPIIDGREIPNTNISGNGSPRQDAKPKDAGEPPISVFIDIPIINPNEINGRREDTMSGDNSGFVEDTIFYDPFEDRRINVRNQESQSTDTPESTQNPTASEATTSIAGSSSGPDQRNQAPPQPRKPPPMYKEANVYGSRTPDDFSISPIPVSEFPEPPPAYSEVDRRVTERPRTVVVVPDANNAVGIASEERKFLVCPHCSIQVNTMVIPENGVLTHVLAGIFLFVFAPITCVIYCSNYCKYRNHYCPNCNQLIGYEVPILCQDMVYTKP